MPFLDYAPHFLLFSKCRDAVSSELSGDKEGPGCALERD